MNEIIITRSNNTDIWFLRTVKWYMLSALSETIDTTIMANPLMPTMLGFMAATITCEAMCNFGPVATRIYHVIWLVAVVASG